MLSLRIIKYVNCKKKSFGTAETVAILKQVFKKKKNFNIIFARIIFALTFFPQFLRAVTNMCMEDRTCVLIGQSFSLKNHMRAIRNRQ
jgi:hypothetical protein